MGRSCTPSHGVFAVKPLGHFAMVNPPQLSDPWREPVFAMQPDGRITSHPVEPFGLGPQSLMLEGIGLGLAGPSFFTACFSQGAHLRSPLARIRRSHRV